MKITIVLCLFCQICFSQKIINDSIRLTQNFNSVMFTEDQKGLIINEFHRLKSIERSKDLSQSKGFVNQKINLYSYSILNESQKSLYNNSWRDFTLRLIQSYYHYLNLSEQQKENIIDIMIHEEGYDTLMVVKETPKLERNVIISVLDSAQLHIEIKQQKESQLLFEKDRRWQDHLRAQDTAFERLRLSLVSEYSIKYLQKAKRKALNKIIKVKPGDVNSVVQITETYQSRVNSDLDYAIRGCYSKDSVLMYPNNKILAVYKFKRYALLPNLCIYWCRFGKDQTTETNEEEEQILTSLEYLKLTHVHILDKVLTKLKKKRDRLNSKIDAARPPKKSGTVVNIVADDRITALEDYAELLLAPMITN